MIEILNWSVRVASTPHDTPSTGTRPEPRTAASQRDHQILCEVTNSPRQAAIHDRHLLAPGATLDGPALIVEPQTTTYVSADFSAACDASGNLILTRKEDAQ